MRSSIPASRASRSMREGTSAAAAAASLLTPPRRSSSCCCSRCRDLSSSSASPSRRERSATRRCARSRSTSCITEANSLRAVAAFTAAIVRSRLISCCCCSRCCDLSCSSSSPSRPERSVALLCARSRSASWAAAAVGLAAAA
ncbi:unnamed protein product, partial [Ectocarpus sp. 8 AP-2014]